MTPLDTGFFETSLPRDTDCGEWWACAVTSAIFEQYDPMAQVQRTDAANDDWYENLYPPIA